MDKIKILEKIKSIIDQKKESQELIRDCKIDYDSRKLIISCNVGIVATAVVTLHPLALVIDSDETTKHKLSKILTSMIKETSK